MMKQAYSITEVGSSSLKLLNANLTIIDDSKKEDSKSTFISGENVKIIYEKLHAEIDSLSIYYNLKRLIQVSIKKGSRVYPEFKISVNQLYGLEKKLNTGPLNQLNDLETQKLNQLINEPSIRFHSSSHEQINIQVLAF